MLRGVARWRSPCKGEIVVLPLLPFLLGRVTCTECGKDEVKTRATLKVGANRKCSHCGKTYRLTEIRNVASRGPGRPPKSKKR